MTAMAFKIFLICGTDPSEQVAAWRLQTLATSYGMHVTVPNRNGAIKGGMIDQVRRAIDQSDCVLAIITGSIGPAVAAELTMLWSRASSLFPLYGRVLRSRQPSGSILCSSSLRGTPAK
jgi:hypothetical protein